MINTLLYVPVMLQHILFMCICCIRCREVGRSTDLPATDTTYTHTHDLLLHDRNTRGLEL